MVSKGAKGPLKLKRNGLAGRGGGGKGLVAQDAELGRQKGWLRFTILEKTFFHYLTHL